MYTVEYVNYANSEHKITHIGPARNAEHALCIFVQIYGRACEALRVLKQ